MIASFLLFVFIGFFFVVPVIPVEGTQIWPAGHCLVITWKWTDWESAGYHFLGFGFNLRLWIEHNFCM